MFKLESYVTPYIFAYLGKYFKNFEPSDFQMSLWSGGAVFQNLNLDLEVLDEELCLPVTFVSGHIHELRISIPWTKVTSEPIQININTIEITLKLKRLEEGADGASEGVKAHVASSKKVEVEEPSAESPPPGYMHNLISKILTNVHVHFENVIVKYVEEDIVLSLNIKKASYSTTDPDWLSSFVDLVAPNFELRKKFEFSDLTICLDKTNTAGKIETYQEPLLYKCSFAVRIFQQFKSSFSKVAHFTRMDFLLNDMDFSITDEQVPMLMRLYYLLRSLFEVNLQTVPLNAATSSTAFAGRADVKDSGGLEDAEEDEGGGDEGSLLDWGSWAISWLPPISAVLGEETEDGVVQYETEEEDKSNFLCHYGFYINNLSVTFKALERICDKPSYGRTIKVKFLPFLKCSLQGITADFVLRGDEANYVCGVSHIAVDPVGFCPCGIVDGVTVQDSSNAQKSAQYIRVGRYSPHYAKTSMFSNTSDTFPLFDYNFQYEGHVEAFSEEMMLERTPAFAVEYLQTRNSVGQRNFSEQESDYYENVADETVDLGKDKLLTRVVLAPCYVAVCSGLVHRLKMISFAVESYNYEPYGEINRLMPRRMLKDRVQGPLDLTIYRNFEEAYDVYQFTVIRPQIEIWAADHPEYSFESRAKHLDQKRRIKTGTPFSHFVPNWPKLLLVAECIDAKMLDPNLKFKSLVAKAGGGSNSSLPPSILSPFLSSTETKMYGFEVSLISGAYVANLCSPCSLTYLQKQQYRLDLNHDRLARSSETYFSTESISVQCSWAEFLLAQVIVVSTVQNMERFSEHLISSSLLYDLQKESSSRLVVDVSNLNFLRILTVCTQSDRFCVGGCKIELEGPSIKGRLPIFHALSPLEDSEDKSFAFFLIQRPLGAKEEVGEENISGEKGSLIPVFIMKLLTCQMYYQKEVFCWMNYRPHIIECKIPPFTRMRNDVKLPLRPSSCSSSREGSRMSGGKPAGRTLSSSDGPSAPGTVSEMDGVGGVSQGPYRQTEGPTKDSMPDSHGSSRGGSIKSSIPGYQMPPRKVGSLEADLEEHRQNLIDKWELWFLSHLNVIKNTFVHLDVGEAELWFHLKSAHKIIQSNQQPHDSIFIKFPKIHSQPQSFKIETDFHEMTLPLKLSSHDFGRDLFPHRISLDNMYVGTVGEKVGRELCSVPLSILVTFSLTTKGKELGSAVTTTTACIHTDIAVIEVDLSHSQVLLFIGLAEELLESVLTFKQFSGTLFLPPDDPEGINLAEEAEEKLMSETKSEASSYAMSNTNSAAAKTNSNFEKDPSGQLQTSYDDSIPGSGYGWTNPSTVGPKEPLNENIEDIKVTCWVQMTVGMYRFSVSSASPDCGTDSIQKLVFEAEDIVSSLDIQSVFIKWSHKVSNIRLRNYEKKLVSGGGGIVWNPGATLGVVISSGDEVTREIQILASSFNDTTEGRNCNSEMSLPISLGRSGGGGAPAHQKMRGSITMTFTRVQSTNFHQKSGVPSPMSKWNSTVYKFADKDYELYAPYDEEDMRSLSEIDIQIKALDFVFNPEVIGRYADLIERILKINVPAGLLNPSTDGSDSCIVPACSNNTLPLVYMKTEAIRVFLKSNDLPKVPSDKFQRNFNDFILIECSAISVVSQTENPLNRTVVTPILFQMAEKARILGVPGSPVEDRQYQIDFQGVTVSTGLWEDIHSKSQRTNLRSSGMLKTQGENPALEWNNRTGEMVLEDVKTYPVLDRMEFTVGLAPAIVYERRCNDSCNCYTVAGHALEVNVVSDINVNLNLQQLTCIRQFCSQTSDIFMIITRSYSTSGQIPSIDIDVTHEGMRDDEEGACRRSRASSIGGFDSGIDSLAHLPKIGLKINRRPGDALRKEDHGNRSPSHRHRRDMVPVDALLTSGMTTITLYDLKFNSVKEVEGVIPLASVTITQPHFVISASQRLQKAEVSLFELSVKLGSGSSSNILPPHNTHKLSSSKLNDRFEGASGTMSWIPGPDKFDQTIFDSIPSERDAKTGMVPAFFTLKLTNFLNQPCGLSCDISRPVKTLLSQQRLRNILSLYKYLVGDNGSPEMKRPNDVEVLTSDQLIAGNQGKEEVVRKLLAGMSTVSVTLKQFVLSMVEGPSEVTIAFGSASLDCRIQNGHFRLAESVVADFYLKAASITTTVQTRLNILLSPCNVHVHGDCRWKSWLEYPMSTVRIASDPVTFHIGPQNILALLQVHHVFQGYLSTTNVVEEENTEVKECSELTSSKLIYDSYEDDLRAGTFKYVRVSSSAELPQVYQIGFCEAHRTMTWRYPQHRVLTSIEACPVPIDNDSTSSLKHHKLECRVEYWDDAMAEFLFYGSFSLSELEGTSVGTPAKDKLHSYISTIWRVKIETALEEADSQHLVRPEILAACLKVNSIHDSSLVPELKIFLEVPRLSIHFVNNFYFGGKGPNSLVRQYSNDSLKHFDQQFASINLEMTSLLISVWRRHCTVNCGSFLSMDVLDYEYLTLSRVVEPVLLKFRLSFVGIESCSRSANSELDVISKNLSVRFGASVLHTLLASLESWSQVLRGWTGSEIDLHVLKTLPSINANQIVIFNTVSQQIKLLQSGADEPTFIRGGECVPFYWPTQKAKPACKLGLREKDWAYTSQFELKKSGYLVRNVHKRPMFIHVAGISATQILVTITGSLLVGNALEENVEVAILLSDRSSEFSWEIPSRGQGPSKMIDLAETEHIRFRIQTAGKSNPWSSVVTPTDLKTSKSRSICVPLFEERNGSLATFSVWCSLVEETVMEAKRYLIILSPFYRVRSFLPSETLVHISTAKQGNKENYMLKGRGIQLQIDFTGSHQVANHLTFQSNPLGSPSTPSIPLLPDGPTLEMHHVERSIDEILAAINGFPFIHSPGTKEEGKAEDVWPFISDIMPREEEWTVSEQPETDLEVEFAPWIEGLPTVLLDVRPWALLVNLCGTDLLYSSCQDDEDENSWIHHQIPQKSVFSPARISLQKGRFKLGLHLNGAPVRSAKLRFSEDVYRTDVHHANVDCLIPIDSFSRIDLPSGNQVGHLTIETRLRKKVLVMTIKPTFSIANKTGGDVFVQSLSVSSNGGLGVEGSRDWVTGSSNFLKLIPEKSLKAFPLLSFTSDDGDYSAHKKNVKHLAVSCGGPWWFVQLIDFGLVFNNMNSSQGVPAAALSVTIPKHRVPVQNSAAKFLSKMDEELECVTVSIIVSWTSKNGLVWISLSSDPFPQVLLHNQTSVPFLYVQSAGAGGTCLPFQEAQYFEQYLVLPPNSKAHYTFPQKYALFPRLIPEKKNLPLLLLTKLPKEVEGLKYDSSPCNAGFPSEKEDSLEIEGVQKGPHGTLLMPGLRLNWSKELNLDGETSQYLSVGEFVDAKITIEKFGFTYYVYIENMSSVEVSAKDVRRRIQGHGSKISQLESSVSILPIHPNNVCPRQVAASFPIDDLDDQASEKKEQERRVEFGSMRKKETEELLRKGRRRPPWIFRCYLPSLSFVITEDLLSSTERRELISVVAEDLFFEQIVVAEKRELRIFWDNWSHPLQNRQIKVLIGDVQVDSPGFPFERTSDFPVILKQQKDYSRLICPDKYGEAELPEFLSRLASSNNWMISLTLTYIPGSRGGGQEEVESVYLSSGPFCLNVEDRLVDFVFSSLQDTFRVLEERVPALAANLAVYYSEENEVFDDATEDDWSPPSVLGSSSVGGWSKVVDGGGDEVETSSKPAVMEGQGRRRTRSSWATVDEISVSEVRLIQMPEEVFNMLENFSHPIRMERLWIGPLEISLTLRMARLVYLAVDHSGIRIPGFEAVSVLSTSYRIGESLVAHYTTGAIFQIGNPMRLLGSLELLGSPGSLAESVGLGLKDFVLYPYQGILQGPTGFIGGLGNGLSSLVKSITSGTLTSVTNWAWSVSRNIDKLTLDEEEQILTEAARRVQLHGFRDGLLEGLTGFGIRLLGAVGGIAHHPIQNVIQHGASPTSVITGVSKGVIGVVTRPIGGIVQLVAMTGEGVLRGAGWTPQLKPKSEGRVDEMWCSPSSVLKYEMKLEESTEFILLLVHAVQLGQPGTLVPVSLVISNRAVYLIHVAEDLLVSHFPLSLAAVELNEDRNVISLRLAPPKKKDDVSFAKERVIDFVRGSLPLISEACGNVPFSLGQEVQSMADGRKSPIAFQSLTREEVMSLPALSPHQPLSSSSPTMFTAISGSGRSLASSSTSLYPIGHVPPVDWSTGGSDGSSTIGDFIVNPHDKSEFENVLAWVKMCRDDKFFKL